MTITSEIPPGRYESAQLVNHGTLAGATASFNGNEGADWVINTGPMDGVAIAIDRHCAGARLHRYNRGIVQQSKPFFVFGHVGLPLLGRFGPAAPMIGHNEMWRGMSFLSE